MNGAGGFRANPLLAELKCAYPPSEDVLQAIGLGPQERSVVARLWVSEGIPFAFRDCPALYEEARAWLAMGMGLDPKEISMGGSGRLGYSLTSRGWGEAYRLRFSDLDFFAVSERLFEALRRDFLQWCEDYDNGAVIPVSEREARHWAANRQEAPRSISRGFLDSWRVPNRTSYGVFSKTNSRLAGLKAKLHETDVGPKPPGKLTFRCYEDWRSYDRQVTLNLKFAADWSRNRTLG